MEALQVIAPLVGVVLGSVISGIGAHLRARAERKRLIACALSDLLEIRHYVIGVELVLREVRSQVPVSDEEAQLFRTQMNTIVPLDAEIHNRYDEAISLLAGVDPVLAFTMRSKNKVPQILDSLRSISQSLGATASQFSKFESLLRQAITPALDEAVLELAAQHSFSTKRRVRKLVAATDEVPQELTKLLSSVADTSTEEQAIHESRAAS